MAERLARKMQEITSTTNNQIKETVKLHQRKYRAEKKLFLIEGEKPIKEAFKENVEIITLYTTQRYLAKFDFLKDKTILVNDAIMEKISTTDSQCEAVAIAKQSVTSLQKIKDKTRLALIENIKDAGNLGTIIRSATAFGIESIILCEDSIDLYNPKVVRSTVGTMFKLPIVKADMAECKKVFSQHNFIATVVNQPDCIKPQNIDYSKPFVIMAGSEAFGLSEKAINFANTKTTIPMTDKAESLNLSVATSILFYLSSLHIN